MRDVNVAIPQSLTNELEEFLIREDGQENLLFALYTQSKGLTRETILTHTLIFPESDEHQIHGNVSFNRKYLERVYKLAMQQDQCGIVFLHSHPALGWQNMSDDDVAAEQYISRGAFTCTSLPLVGMTVGMDGIWSARVWDHIGDGEFSRNWCQQVRIVGKQIKFSFADHLISKPQLDPIFQNSVNVFGKDFHVAQQLHVGIVGLGSVGSRVAETLARMGFTKFTLIDFDEVQNHNLDRLVGATRNDLKKLKIAVAKEHIQNCAITDSVKVRTVPSSLIESEGYAAALDCDVIFSCVDRPFPRKILNHIAFAHLIPVIDGGIAVRFKDEDFSGVDWQLQTATPQNPCLKCCGCYNETDADLDRQGLLDNPTYMPKTQQNHNENVFPFSANLSSLEVLQLIALITGKQDFGIQRFRFHPGVVENHLEDNRSPCNCMDKLIAQGDRYFSLLVNQDHTAENARIRQEMTLN